MRTSRAAIAGLLAAAVLAGSAGSAGAATGYAPNASLTIVGRGRAHGVGLCMSSVKNMARAGYTYRQILPYFYRGTRVQTKRNLPGRVRVGVYKRSGTISVSNGIGRRFVVRTASGRTLWRIGAGATVGARYVSGAYTVTLSRGGRVVSSRRVTSPARIYPGTGTILKVANDGHMYRGAMELRYGKASQAMWAVNIVPIESYLRGLGEEPESWPITGLKVLAVVSRGYAAYRSLNPKHSGDGFAICNTGDCQAYVGYNYERHAPRLSTAVRVTRNVVVTYGGRLVVTPYFSNSGGQTENIEYVWGGPSRPWLKGVRTRWAKPHPAYSWSEKLSFRSMKIRLARSGETKVRGSLLGFRILSTGVSPRVRRMSVLDVVRGRTISRVTSGETLRNVASLQSTWFRFDMPPRLTSVAASPSTFSPNGDRVADVTRAYFTLSESARVMYAVYNASGRRMDYSGYVRMASGRRSVVWDGKSLAGRRLPDGRYRILVVAQDGRRNTNYASVWVTSNKLLGFVYARPATISPNGDGVNETATVHFKLDRRARIDVRVRNSGGTTVRLLTYGWRSGGWYRFGWGGRNQSDATVPAGTYRYLVSATDGTYNAARSGTIGVSSGQAGVASSLIGKLPGWLVPGNE